ncbi:MAG TPA: hypothetical protein DCX77_05605 [Acidimicrobiaceae bacterium]|nr:hypothetical protein [Acidimicrobiaceae bacterium]HAX05135.1 hypothetical protein [Acidimicrobiaceae bacterium]|tara:strand:+ start:105 stop:386 length:282 start_codon:yes stop_codon:yes gene_type:complete
MRLKAIFLTIAIFGSSCAASPEWDGSQKTNFLRACRREAGYDKQDLCTPLAVEIEERIKQGASKSCLLFAANDIAVAINPDEQEQARQQFDSC